MHAPESQTTPERLRSVLADVFDIPLEQVTPDLALGSIEAWDSYGHLQAVLAVEAEFGVQFRPDVIPNLRSVNHLQKELHAMGVTP